MNIWLVCWIKSAKWLKHHVLARWVVAHESPHCAAAAATAVAAYCGLPLEAAQKLAARKIDSRAEEHGGCAAEHSWGLHGTRRSCTYASPSPCWACAAAWAGGSSGGGSAGSGSSGG